MTRIDLQNILFDQESNHLTAIQDFDFSHVASLVDEYFCFLHSIYSLLTGPLEGEEFKTLRMAQLSGFTTTTFAPAEGKEPEVNWDIAKVGDKEIEKQGVLNPGNIAGIEDVTALYWFLIDVGPQYFLMGRWLERKSVEGRSEEGGGGKFGEVFERTVILVSLMRMSIYAQNEI